MTSLPERARDVRHAIAEIVTAHGGQWSGAVDAAVDAVLREALAVEIRPTADMAALLDGLTLEQQVRIVRAINAAMAATLAATAQAAAYQDQVLAAHQQTLDSQRQTRAIIRTLHTIVMASYTPGDATPLHETLLPILRAALELPRSLPRSHTQEDGSNLH